MLVLIPSYFNNQNNRRERFKEVIKSHLALNNTIKVLWMNNEEPEIQNSNIEYTHSERMNASKARNKLLASFFYNTEEQYCILSDDDTVIFENVDISTYDCVSYTNDYYRNCRRTEKISSSFLVIKNIKEYFDETLEANQDLDFGISLNKKGFTTLRCGTDKVEIYRGNSSMFKNRLDAIYKKQNALKIINIKNNG